MNYQIEKNDDVQLIRIHEERLNSNLAPELKTIFLVLIKPENSQILIDLEKVKYVDSSGLGALLFGLRQARNHGGVVKLLKAQNRVLDLIRIAQLENILVNFTNEQEALESYVS